MKRRLFLPGLVLFTGSLACVLPSAAVLRAQDITPDQLLRNIAARRFTGKPVTIRVTRDNVRSAVEEIRKASGLSIDIDPAVYELIRINASEKNLILANEMPWDALLDVLLKEFQLGLTIEGGGLALRSIGAESRFLTVAERPASSFPWVWILIPAFVLAAGAAGGVFRARRRAARKRKGNGFALDPGTAEEIKARIVYLFEVDKIHDDEDVSLPALSARLNLPAHHVSRVINDVMGMSFSRLVNTYRVNEVKKKLLDSADDGRTILDIAFEAGFGTKTAFNKEFKRQTGMTPSEFRDRSRG